MLVRSRPDTDYIVKSASSPTSMQLAQILVVDSNPQVRKACREVAEGLGLLVSEAENVSIASEILSQKQAAILLLDVTRLENGGQVFLKELKALYPKILVIVMSGCATISAAVESMKIGACDYLSKPFPLNVLTQTLERVANRWHFDNESGLLQGKLQIDSEMANSLGQSPEMEKLYRILSSVANSTHPVMILGESGTGKALVAQAIHSNGRHASKPFIIVDCKSLAPILLDDVLFGQAKGSRNREDMLKFGLLSSPKGGTVFLNEIGSLPLELQGKLMKTLRKKETHSHGATQPTRVTVRVLAATSNDLMRMVRGGLFRMDLYRLLSIVNLTIPPLRGRPNDIAFLAKRFLEKIQHKTGVMRTLSQETLRMLETYDWPDNIQELENTIGHACSQSSGPNLQTIHLPQKLLNFHRPTALAPKLPSTEGSSKAAAEESIVPIAKMEERAILEAMRQTNGNKLMAAELLGIGKTTLYRKLKEYDLSNKTISATPSAGSATDLGGTKPALNCA